MEKYPQLQDIISPGLFVSTGTPWPVSINLGAQIGPNLRKVTSEKTDYGNSYYVRYSASLCVDIPLIDLYTVERGEN